MLVTVHKFLWGSPEESSVSHVKVKHPKSEWAPKVTQKSQAPSSQTPSIPAFSCCNCLVLCRFVFSVLIILLLSLRKLNQQQMTRRKDIILSLSLLLRHFQRTLRRSKGTRASSHSSLFSGYQPCASLVTGRCWWKFTGSLKPCEVLPRLTDIFTAMQLGSGKGGTCPRVVCLYRLCFCPPGTP